MPPARYWQPSANQHERWPSHATEGKPRLQFVMRTLSKGRRPQHPSVHLHDVGQAPRQCTHWPALSKHTPQGLWVVLQPLLQRQGALGSCCRGGGRDHGRAAGVRAHPAKHTQRMTPAITPCRRCICKPALVGTTFHLMPAKGLAAGSMPTTQPRHILHFPCTHQSSANVSAGPGPPVPSTPLARARSNTYSNQGTGCEPRG